MGGYKSPSANHARRNQQGCPFTGMNILPILLEKKWLGEELSTSI
jgi:hypothetical protein